jgi:hypothetical protein
VKEAAQCGEIAVGVPRSVGKYVSVGRGAQEMHRPIRANKKSANVAERG